MNFFDSVMSTPKNKNNSDGTRFLVISCIEDGALTKLSPFAIEKAIVGLAWLVSQNLLRKYKQVYFLNVIQKSIQTTFLNRQFFVNCQLRWSRMPPSIHPRE